MSWFNSHTLLILVGFAGLPGRPSPKKISVTRILYTLSKQYLSMMWFVFGGCFELVCCFIAFSSPLLKVLCHLFFCFFFLLSWVKWKNKMAQLLFIAGISTQVPNAAPTIGICFNREMVKALQQCLLCSARSEGIKVQLTFRRFPPLVRFKDLALLCG